MSEHKVIAVIPAFNPDKVLINIVNGLIQNGFEKIVIINDGSAEDNNVFMLLKTNREVEILKHAVNLGKGRALKTAFNYILNHFSQYQGVITIDADGQHRISDIQKCTEHLEAHYMDTGIILGCRQFEKSRQVPFRSRFGNLCTKQILRYLCNIRVSDSQTGLRGIPMHLLPAFMSVIGEGYEYETNMLLKLAEMNGKIEEVQIEAVYENNNNTSHFNPVMDSVKIYAIIFKYSLASIMSAMIDNLTFICLRSYVNNIYAMTFMSRAAAAVFNFTINKKIVFQKKGHVIRQSVKYVCLLAVSGSISAFFVSVFHKLLHINIVLLKFFVELILYFLNFYMQKNFIFNEKGSKNDACKD